MQLSPHSPPSLASREREVFNGVSPLPLSRRLSNSLRSRDASEGIWVSKGNYLVNIMERTKEITELLLKVKHLYGNSRAEYIRKLQDKIWDETSDNAELEAFLSTLAGDLNFYETNEEDRDESLGYYGDKRLDEIINAAIESLKQY